MRQLYGLLNRVTGRDYSNVDLLLTRRTDTPYRHEARPLERADLGLQERITSVMDCALQTSAECQKRYPAVQSLQIQPRVCADAVERAFGMDVDYAMLIKLYGTPSKRRHAVQPG